MTTMSKDKPELGVMETTRDGWEVIPKDECPWWKHGSLSILAYKKDGPYFLARLAKDGPRFVSHGITGKPLMWRSLRKACDARADHEVREILQYNASRKVAKSSPSAAMHA